MLKARATDSAAAARAGDATERSMLRGWKEIGRHFGVDERTAKRWEASRGLPVHRLPGKARAPVFAYHGELHAWMERAGGAVAEAVPVVETAAQPGRAAAERRPWLILALLGVALVAALWFGIQAVEGEREAAIRTDELTRLASAQVAAVNDQLDSPPGTVSVRAALAEEAVRVLGRVAGLPGADRGLRREAAEGWRRLAVLQNAVDRPSLRDRASAQASLREALALLDGDRSAEAALARARVQVEAARQAGGAGQLEAAEGHLSEAWAVARSAPASALEMDWWLARSEVSSWAGDHAASLDAARRVQDAEAGDAERLLRELKARDLEAEALYYLRDPGGARAVYARSVETARAGVVRWPTDNRLRWALLRQQWNLGSTLVTMGQARAAVPVLAEALAAWDALARADPSDEAVAAWVRAVRLSYGQALVAGGNRASAIPVLSQVVAERRQWLAARSDDADRRRMLLRGLAVLGDALAPGGRIAEACALYAEASALAARMATDGQLTGLDRSETLRLVGEAQERHCAALP